MRMLELRNGTEEEALRVAGVSAALVFLLDNRPLALIDFIMHCQGKKQEMYPSSIRDLHQAYLLEEDGTVSDSVRNVVLSTVIRKNDVYIFVSPRKRY